MIAIAESSAATVAAADDNDYDADDEFSKKINGKKCHYNFFVQHAI